VDRDHELSAVLADDTRYNIYRWIAEQPGTDVTVADVATEFGLHPNVARMHLAKLEQAGFLATGFRRAAGGGRPAKLYRLSDLVVTFGFPPRRYELLSRLAIESLSAGGTREDALRVCREAGVAEGRRALAGDAETPKNRAAAAALVLHETASTPIGRIVLPAVGDVVVVVGPDGTVKYTELVPEIAQEPDYDAALAAL